MKDEERCLVHPSSFTLHPSMRTLKLTLAYDGTDYFGWQYQPDRPTVQGTLEAALKGVTQEEIRITGSGRTDAGVHALGQVVSFQTGTRLSCAELMKALNATLPEDMAVLELAEAPDDFHAIRSAVRKRYRYQIYDGPVADVFRRRWVWHIRHRLDEQAMHEAAQALVGTHDFASFETQGTERESSIRTVSHLSVTRGAGQDTNLLTLEIEADGFLYNMVRTMVGTLVKVGRGREPIAWPNEVLQARDRRLAGMTAPPQGLFLVRVEY
jgi:tRNA pseudouridine38-40 synthase